LTTTLTIPAGQTSGTFTVTPVNDGIMDGDRTLLLGFATLTDAQAGIHRVRGGQLLPAEGRKQHLDASVPVRLNADAGVARGHVVLRQQCDPQ
jgi:hypothetical protein